MKISLLGVVTLLFASFSACDADLTKEGFKRQADPVPEFDGLTSVSQAEDGGIALTWEAPETYIGDLTFKIYMKETDSLPQGESLGNVGGRALKKFRLEGENHKEWKHLGDFKTVNAPFIVGSETTKFEKSYVFWVKAVTDGEFFDTNVNAIGLSAHPITDYIDQPCSAIEQTGDYDVEIKKDLPDFAERVFVLRDDAVIGTIDRDNASVVDQDADEKRVYKYKCNVAIKSFVAEGSATEFSLSGKPPVPGGDGILKYQRTSATSIRVAWAQGRDARTATRELEYMLFRTVGEMPEDPQEIEKIADGVKGYNVNMTEVLVENLLPDTEYSFTVIVRDGSGLKAKYKTISIKSSEDQNPPIPGSAVEVVESRDSSATLRFSKGKDDHTATELLRYGIYASDKPIDARANIASLSRNTTEFTQWSTTVDAKNLLPNRTYHLAVLVMDLAGNVGMYAPVQVTTTPDQTPPVPGNGQPAVLPANVTFESANLYWAKAKDNYSPVHKLKYYVHSVKDGTLSSTNDFSNLTLVHSELDIKEYSVSGLDPSSSYTFNIVVEDEAGNQAIYDSVTIKTSDVPASDLEIVSGNMSQHEAGSALKGSLSNNIKVEVKTSIGSLASDYQGKVYLRTKGVNDSLKGVKSVNAVNGIATFQNVSIEKAGLNYIIEAYVGSLNPAETNSFNVVPGPVAKLDFIGNISDTEATKVIDSDASAKTEVLVEAQDAYGNATGNGLSAEISFENDPNASVPSVLTGGSSQALNANGRAVFSNLRIDLVGNRYTLRASITGQASIKGVSNEFDSTPAPPSHIVCKVKPTGSHVAGTAHSFEFEVIGTNGQKATGWDGQIALEVGSYQAGSYGVKAPAIVDGPHITPSVGTGVFSFADKKIEVAGDYQIRARALNATFATSSSVDCPSFTVTPDVPSELAFDSDLKNIKMGDPLASVDLEDQIRVDVLDQFGNLSPVSDSIVVSIETDGVKNLNSSLSTTLAGNTSKALVNGTSAVFNDLTMDQIADQYRLKAELQANNSVSGLSNFFNSTATPPDHIQCEMVTSGPIQAGDTIELRMTVRAQHPTLNPLPVYLGFASDIVAKIDNGSAATTFTSGTSSKTAIQGVATFDNLILTKAGSYSITAVTTTSMVNDPVTCDFDVLPGPVSKIAFTEDVSNAVSKDIIKNSSGGEISLELRDDYDNVVDGTDSVVMEFANSPAPGAAVLSGTTTKQAAAGSVNFDDLSIDIPSSYALRAYLAANNSISTKSNNFSITAKPEIIKCLTAPSGTHQLSDALTFRFGIYDLYDNETPITDSIVLTAVSGPSVTVSPSDTKSISNASEVIFSGITVDKPGTFKFEANELADNLTYDHGDCADDFKVLGAPATITNVSLIEPSNSNTWSKAGDAVKVKVTWNRSVTLKSGIPRLPLNTGSSLNRFATYDSAATAAQGGNNSMVFTYVLQTNNNPAYADYTAQFNVSTSNQNVDLQGAVIEDSDDTPVGVNYSTASLEVAPTNTGIDTLAPPSFITVNATKGSADGEIDLSWAYSNARKDARGEWDDIKNILVFYTQGSVAPSFCDATPNLTLTATSAGFVSTNLLMPAPATEYSILLCTEDHAGNISESGKSATAMSGGSMQRVFTTSATYLGSQIRNGAHETSPLRGADKYCKNAADASSKSFMRGLTWKAVISSVDLSAKNRVPIYSGGVFTSQGTKAFSNAGDMWGSSAQNAMNINESGQTISGSRYVWTGSGSGGNKSGGDCSNWESSGTAITGDPGDPGSWLNRGSPGTCTSDQHSLLCVSVKDYKNLEDFRGEKGPNDGEAKLYIDMPTDVSEYSKIRLLHQAGNTAPAADDCTLPLPANLKKQWTSPGSVPAEQVIAALSPLTKHSFTICVLNSDNIVLDTMKAEGISVISSFVLTARNVTTFTVPEGFSTVKVWAIGAGGGGAGAYYADGRGAAGGAGGVAYKEFTVVAGQTITYQLGSGGGGGAANFAHSSSQGFGWPGGDTTVTLMDANTLINTTMVAGGGNGGYYHAGGAAGGSCNGAEDICGSGDTGHSDRDGGNISKTANDPGDDPEGIYPTFMNIVSALGYDTTGGGVACTNAQGFGLGGGIGRDNCNAGNGLYGGGGGGTRGVGNGSGSRGGAGGHGVLILKFDP